MPSGDQGFIQILVIIVIALVLLRWLGINLTAILAEPAVHDFAVFVKQNLILVWHDLKEIFFFVKSA